MDSITQIALGATIGEAGFRGRLGGKAVVVGGACGLLPDLDLLLSIGDPLASMVVHRGSSHSLLVLPVVAFAVGWLAQRWARRGRYLDWVHLCFWGLVTHPLLDVFTAYGTQLLAPFDRTRFALDGVAILDPVYSLPLFVAVVLAARGHRRRSQRYAVAALLFTTAYLGAGYAASQRAIALARAALEREHFEVRAIRATPTMFNNMLFRVVAQDARHNLRVGHVSIVADRASAFRALQWPDQDPWAARMLASDVGELFTWFSGGFLFPEVRPREGGADVVLSDQKYGLFVEPTRSFMGVVGRFDVNGKLQRVERLTPQQVPIRYGEELALQWRLLRTGRR